MHYLQRPPRPELAPFVESLWYQEAESEARPSEPTLVVPGLGVELIVNFAEPFEQIADGATTTLPAIHAAGQRTRSVRARATGRTGMVIVRCRPWAAAGLLGESAAELVDGLVDLGENDGLLEELRDATTPDESLDRVERRLEKSFADHRPDRLVVAAAHHLNEHWGDCRIDALASRFSISRRQLQRRFLRATGIGPKRFARLVRYQKALGCLRMGYEIWDVVERCGYVDQAHLIGELGTFAGLPPGAILERARTPLMRFYNVRHVERLHNTTYL